MAHLIFPLHNPVSPPCRFHPLCWLSCLFILNLLVVGGQTIALGLITFIIFILMRLNRISCITLLKSLKGLILFVFVIWGVLVLGKPTLEGLTTGTITAWRFILLILLGSLLTAATSLTELQTLLEKLLKPFPFLPATRLSMLFTLTLRFLVLIGQKSQAAREAQWARGIQARKNPIYHLVCYTTVLFRNLFLQADELSEALEARCYTETRERTGAESTTFIDSKAVFANFKAADITLSTLILLMSGCLLIFRL